MMQKILANKQINNYVYNYQKFKYCLKLKLQLLLLLYIINNLCKIFFFRFDCCVKENNLCDKIKRSKWSCRV